MSDSTPLRPSLLSQPQEMIQWADRIEARGQFPRLIRRLISHSNYDVIRIDVRADEGVGLPGFDGVVEATRGTTMVPQGLSIWELGVSQDPGSKAKADYQKRTDELGEGNSSDSTFIFATPRKWPGKQAWEAQKRAECRWRDVRAFDVDDLQTTLEECPAAHIWFSEMIGRSAAGARLLESWWESATTRTNPLLTPNLILAGREEIAAKLLDHWQNPNARFSIAAIHNDEALLAIGAALHGRDESNKSELLSRTLVVNDSRFVRWLDGTSGLILVLPDFPEMRQAAEATFGPSIVYLTGQEHPSNILIPPVDIHVFRELLVQDEIEESRALSLARSAARSLRSFQRAAANDPNDFTPTWSGDLSSPLVRRAWLAGGWDERRAGDLEELEKLFGSSYDSASGTLVPLGRLADPLFTFVGGSWKVTDIRESWKYAKGKLTHQDLQILEQTIQNTLGSVDPALNLPIEKRWTAGIFGHGPIFSRQLRIGLATTLALIGTYGDEVNLDGDTTARTWAESTIYKLLSRANEDSSGQIWSSMSDVLPLLAEAAPDIFLREVGRTLEGSVPILALLFTDKINDLFAPSSPHTGLLWALERLALSEDYFALSMTHLTKLATIDPGGTQSNRPANSLATIFRPWLPQTSATVDRRKKVLKTIVRRSPEVSESLLLSLLPDRNGYILPSDTAMFREWAAQESVTRSEFSDFTDFLTAELAALAIQRPSIWKRLVAKLADLDTKNRYILLDTLDKCADAIDPVQVVEIWEELISLANRHRSFPDAAWRLSDTDLDRVESTADKIQPSDPCKLHRRLFADVFPDIVHDQEQDFKQQQKQLTILRQSAAQEIIDSIGISGLTEFAQSVPASYQLGIALAAVDCNLEARSQVLDLLDSDNGNAVNFAFGYSRTLSEGKSEWIEEAVATFSDRPTIQARLVACGNDLPSMWALAQLLGDKVDTTYWSEFNVTGRGQNFDLANEAAVHLSKVGQHAAAIQILSMYRDNSENPLDFEVVVSVLRDLFQDPNSNFQSVRTYELETLLEFLRQSPLSEDEIAILEWSLLPALDFETSVPVLSRRLAKDPNFSSK